MRPPLANVSRTGTEGLLAPTTGQESELLVSFVIPNLNGIDFLRSCVSSIKAQSYRRIELILVDNGSSDDSAEYVKTVLPNSTIIRNDRNLGFAIAVNQGVRASSGEYVFILNNDASLAPDCVSVLMDGMLEWEKREGSKVIGLAPKILLSGRSIIDAVGNAINPDGSAFNVGIGQIDMGQFDNPNRVMGLCFAAAFIRKAAFQLVGFLDESYFAYYEDVDWCYRANVLGYEFHSAPRAVVQHHHSGSARELLTSDQKYYLIHRNFLRTILKNYYRGNLIQVTKKVAAHSHEIYRNLRRLKFRKAWLHTKILGGTFLRSPLLLVSNLRLNRRRKVIDPEIWDLASERIVQFSVSTFDPTTYSPIATLDVMEETAQHLLWKMRRKEYLGPYLGVHLINYMVKLGVLRLLPRVRSFMRQLLRR